MVQFDQRTYVPERRIVYTSEIMRDEFAWLYDKCKSIVEELNRKFDFSITALDDITFMKYQEPADSLGGGHFHWHSDCGKGQSALRKISISIALNDGCEYEGGDFCVFDCGPLTLPRMKCGDVIAIPSYVNHRVTPVTKGTRYVLVLFVLGPRMR